MGGGMRHAWVPHWDPDPNPVSSPFPITTLCDARDVYVRTAPLHTPQGIPELANPNPELDPDPDPNPNPEP